MYAIRFMHVHAPSEVYLPDMNNHLRSDPNCAHTVQTPHTLVMLLDSGV